MKQIDTKNIELNKLYMVSANQGYTWFPVKFLWIGNITHVWSNCIGSDDGSERAESFSVSKWKVCEFDNFEPRVYYKPELQKLGYL